MSNFPKPATLEEFEKNFEQIKPLMDANMAYYESSRCLFCYDAPCIKACPTGIDIPLFIKQINTQNLTGAARTIYSANYFGHTCGKVCPTDVLCEGACVYNDQGVKPIEIGRLQSYAATDAIRKQKSLFKTDRSDGYKIAVIGAGPAGIACACELSQLGYVVTIFEAREQPSGLALHGTAPYKIENKDVLEEVDYLQQQFGFDIHYGRRIESTENFKQLENEYSAIFLGIGLGNTRKTDTPGEDLEGCLGATEFIEQLKLNPLSTNIGKRVIVIGGGNTAMDAASESARMGADSTLIYRRSKEEMGAYEFEYDLLLSVGGKAIFNTAITEIKESGISYEVSCVKTENKDGQLHPIQGSAFTLSCDQIIFATGQEKQRTLLDNAGLSYDSKGRISIDSDSGQCSKPNYFAGGDAVNGGAEVVNACAEGKRAAQHIHAYLIKS